MKEDCWERIRSGSFCSAIAFVGATTFLIFGPGMQKVQNQILGKRADVRPDKEGEFWPVSPAELLQPYMGVSALFLRNAFCGEPVAAPKVAPAFGELWDSAEAKSSKDGVE